MSTNNSAARIEIVDALRGFAILSIMLLHHLEHFDFYYFPDYYPAWLKACDGVIWKTMFFLFSGKSYAIFALLFGFTFNLMFSRRQNEGYDFRPRFAWRLVVLLGFGMFNSIFYEGDILTIYAILGFTLIPVSRLSNKTVLIIATILMLQPFEIGRFIYMLSHSGYVPVRASDFYFGKIGEYLSGNSFTALAVGNLTTGKTAVLYWSWENGRFFQAPALFMLGMLLGRTGLFLQSDSNLKFWKLALWISLTGFAMLFIIKLLLLPSIFNKVLNDQAGMIVTSWANFAFMVFLVSTFIVLYQKHSVSKLLSKLIPFGRMTLSNYIIQSVTGAFLYYGFAFGLYKYTGAAICFVIGFMLFVAQLYFCKWWLKTHKQGPLEALWHKATWIKLKK